MEQRNETEDNSDEYQQQLVALAGEVLNEDGQDEIAVYIQDGKFVRAREYLLGAVDRSFLEGELTKEEAREKYRLLNIDPERASRLRQSHGTKS